MCWLSKVEKIPRTAGEDIPVYKVMWLPYEEGKFYSYYNEMEYEVRKVYSMEDFKPENAEFILFGYSMRIDEGFHSYNKDKTKIYDRLFCWEIQGSTECFPMYSRDIILTPPTDCKYKDIVAVKCIIPKGSTYYENEYGEIVSDKIMVTDEIIRRFNSKDRVRLNANKTIS